MTCDLLYECPKRNVRQSGSLKRANFWITTVGDGQKTVHTDYLDSMSEKIVTCRTEAPRPDGVTDMKMPWLLVHALTD